MSIFSCLFLFLLLFLTIIDLSRRRDFVYLCWRSLWTLFGCKIRYLLLFLSKVEQQQRYTALMSSFIGLRILSFESNQNAKYMSSSQLLFCFLSFDRRDFLVQVFRWQEGLSSQELYCNPLFSPSSCLFWRKLLFCPFRGSQLNNTRVEMKTTRKEDIQEPTERERDKSNKRSLKTWEKRLPWNCN